VLVTYRRSEDRARAVADRIAARGGQALVAQADLGSRAACEALVADARERLGGIDVWVNNAGADVLTGEAAQWPAERKLEALLAVDLKATIRCSRLVAARMRPGGSILNIGWDHATVDGMAGDNPAEERPKHLGCNVRGHCAPGKLPSDFVLHVNNSHCIVAEGLHHVLGAGRNHLRRRR